MSKFKESFINWLSLTSSVDYSEVENLEATGKLELVVLTAAGTFKGTADFPTNESTISSDFIGAMWTANLEEHPDDVEKSDNIRSIWLSNVTEINTGLTYNRLVLFSEDVIGLTLAGSVDFSVAD